MSEQPETFTSRWGFVLAAMGMAVGTGNVWRFPRIFAANQGGAFLIPWLIFLFTWSIPLLILEVGMGKKARKGLVGAFSTLIGRRYAWMGGFVALVTIFIMLILVLWYPILFAFLAVWGWVFGIIGAILTIAGHLLKRGQRIACTKCCLG